MKKITYWLGVLALAVTSCSPSLEEKANALIEKHVKSCLYVPESYECVTTEVDSAFAPLCDPAFHGKLLKLRKVVSNIEELDRKIELEESDISSAEAAMEIFSDEYMFGKHAYKKWKKSIDEHTATLTSLIKEKENLLQKKEVLVDSIKSRFLEPQEFIGYQVYHRYRAETNVGIRLLGNAFYVLNKDLSEILLVYDLESEEYEFINAAIEQLKESEEI